MNRKSLIGLLRLLKGHIWAIPIIIGLSFVATVAEGIGIGLVIPFLGIFLGQSDQLSNAGGPVVEFVQRYADLFAENERVTILSASICALIGLKALLIYADGLLSSWISGRITHTIRVALFRQMLDVDYEYISTKDNGKLLNTLDTEVTHTTEALTTIFNSIMRFCVIIVFSCLLALISWRLTASVIVAALFISLFIRLFTMRAGRLGEAIVRAHQKLYERSVELFDAMRVIRAFGQEAREVQRFDAASQAARMATLQKNAISGLLYPLLEVLYAGLLIGVVLLGVSMNLGMPTLLVFLVLFYRLQPHIRGIDHNRVYLASLAAGVRDVTEMLDRGGKPYMQSGTRVFQALQDSIEFREVSFSYGASDHGLKDDVRPALQDVSLRFRSGEVTAIVGASGAGKSTLINLLYRFHDATAGRVLVDGHPLSEFDLASWRAGLAIAGQDAELMTGTIEENISFGKPEADRTAINRAARMADAHDFIMALPKGYDTRVGERGLFLSGGQRQRIGVARALLREPRVLIFDEATNSLDSFSEAYIQETLKGLRRRMTVILVAHRLSTTRDADQVIVLNEGRVAECGDPSDLVNRNGLFARLYELQRLSYGVPGPAVARSSPEPAATNDAAE